MLLQLESARLSLRNLHEEDLPAFLDYRSDPEVAKYQGFEPFNEKDAQDFIRLQRDKEFGLPHDWLQLAIIKKSSNQLIGDCAVRLLSDDFQTAEMGCTISPRYQRKGFAREALLLLLQFLFEEKKVRRVVEITDADNLASINLLERIGFRKEGHFIENCWFKGKWGSEMQYALLAREWAAVKQQNAGRS